MTLFNKYPLSLNHEGRLNFRPVFVVALLFVLLLTPTVAFAHEAATPPGEDSPRILASTAWVAAIAQAAGAKNVDILASFELRHPPERDFRPSDIVRATEADIITWAGYENFINQIVEAAEIPETRIVRVSTQNNPTHLINLTRELAEQWGTEAEQRKWEADFTNLINEIEQAAIAQNVASVRVITTGHLTPFLEWLGYDIIETFGFEEMTPVRLRQLQSLNPDIIVDVWHNPTAESLGEVTDALYAPLINFPGRDNTRTLIDVFRYNAQRLNLIQ